MTFRCETLVTKGESSPKSFVNLGDVELTDLSDDVFMGRLPHTRINLSTQQGCLIPTVLKTAQLIGMAWVTAATKR